MITSTATLQALELLLENLLYQVTRTQEAIAQEKRAIIEIEYNSKPSHTMNLEIEKFLKNPIDSFRHKARVLVNKAVKAQTSGAMCLSDLADTFNLCSGLDTLEDMLKDADGSIQLAELLDLAQEIAAELLEEEGFPSDF